VHRVEIILSSAEGVMQSKEVAVFKLWDHRCDLVKQRIWAHLLEKGECEKIRDRLWMKICEVDAELATKWDVRL
jgi:hypothetical protein